MENKTESKTESKTNPNSEKAVIYELSLMSEKFRNIIPNDKDHFQEKAKEGQIQSIDAYYEDEKGERRTLSIKGTSDISNNSGYIEMWGKLRCMRRNEKGESLTRYRYSDDFEKALFGSIDYWAFSCRYSTDPARGLFLLEGKHFKNYLNCKVDLSICNAESPREWARRLYNWKDMMEDVIWEESRGKTGIFRIQLDPKKYIGKKGSIDYYCEIMNNKDSTFSPMVLIPLSTKPGTSFAKTWHYYSEEAINLLGKKI